MKFNLLQNDIEKTLRALKKSPSSSVKRRLLRRLRKLIQEAYAILLENLQTETIHRS